jgi:hypothetical protein
MSSPKRRSRQSRFWRKRRTFKFIVRDDGDLAEETSGMILPAWFFANGFGFPVERVESPNQRRMVAWLFIQECRLSPESPAVPSRDNTDPRAWNSYLRSEGHSTHDEDFVANIALGSDNEGRAAKAEVGRLRRSGSRQGGPRRSTAAAPDRWLLASDAAWRRALVARLAVLFDQEPADTLLQSLATTLTGPRWYEWLNELAFEPMRHTLIGHKSRVPYMAGLHCVIQRRARVKDERAWNRAPIIVTIRAGGRRVMFRVPKRSCHESEASHKRAVAILTALKTVEYGYAYGASTDLALLAAATWIARRYLRAPNAWADATSSQSALAEHFGVPLRRLRVWSRRLKSDPLLGLARTDEIFSPHRGPRRPLPSRVTTNMALNSPVAQSPEGLAAMKMLEDANALQYGLPAEGKRLTVQQARGRLARANALRKKAFAQLVRLHEMHVRTSS